MAKPQPLKAQDKLAFLLSLVPYLLDHGRVSVAEAAEHFAVDEESIRQAVRLIAVSGVPGDTHSYQHGDLFDISWDETAKYLVATPETTEVMANLINRYPDRFLFGTDSVAPKTREQYLKTYEAYAPLLAKLTPEARHQLLKGNYERIFDKARKNVRAWEAANARPRP